MRRCVEKETGREFAAKIIDINDSINESIGHDAKHIREATMREIRILRIVAGHPYISKLNKSIALLLKLEMQKKPVSQS